LWSFSTFSFMSYTIHVRVIQSDASNWWSIVEKSVWCAAGGGTWSEVNGEQILTMPATDTSGYLRFMSPVKDDYFVAILGVQDREKWCDLVSLKASDTCMSIAPLYYNNGPKSEIVGKHLPHHEMHAAKGGLVTVDYYREDGKTFWATISIT
jgi:hypothetical protein